MKWDRLAQTCKSDKQCRSIYVLGWGVPLSFLQNKGRKDVFYSTSQCHVNTSRSISLSLDQLQQEAAAGIRHFTSKGHTCKPDIHLSDGNKYRIWVGKWPGWHSNTLSDSCGWLMTPFFMAQLKTSHKRSKMKRERRVWVLLEMPLCSLSVRESVMWKEMSMNGVDWEV